MLGFIGVVEFRFNAALHLRRSLDVFHVVDPHSDPHQRRAILHCYACVELELPKLKNAFEKEVPLQGCLHIY